MSYPFQIDCGEDCVIRGDFYPAAESPQANVVVCHGFKGFKDWSFIPHIGKTLAKQHFNVFTFNFSHNGVGEDLHNFTELEKFARNTYSRELEDVHTLIQCIQKESLPFVSTHDGSTEETDQTHRGHKQPDASLPLFLLGHSRGGGVSLIYAFDHEQDIDGVISWNGISNVDLFSPEKKEEMRSKGRTYIPNARTQQDMPLEVSILEDIEAHAERFNIMKRVASSSVPITLIQGTEDNPPLLKGSEQLVQQNPSISWVKIEGGNHTFRAVHPFAGETEPLKEAIQESVAFMKQTLQRSHAQ